MKHDSNTMKNTPQIAIIGCGAIAETFYLPAIQQRPNILNNLILIDANEKQAKTVADRFSIKHYNTDYRNVLADIDGAIITVPDHLHYPIAMDVLSHGIHVLCEKPLARSSSEAEAMVKAAKKNNCALAVNYTRRLFPTYQKVKSLISDGSIGDIVSIYYYEGGEFDWPTASGFYFKTTDVPYGVVMDRGAHVLDLITWWLGEKPKIVSSQNDSFGGPEAVAEIEFQQGNCNGFVKLSRLNRLQNRYRVTGTLGHIEGGITDWRFVDLHMPNGRNKKFNLDSTINRYSDFGSALIDNFMEVINGNATPLVSAEDVVNSVKFVEESYKAASRFELPWYEALKGNYVY